MCKHSGMKIHTNVCLWFILCNALGFLYSQGRDFQLITDSNLWMLPLGPGWRSDSKVSCAVSCVKTTSDCYSFTYNVSAQWCVPGTWTAYAATTRDLLRQPLYSAAVCRSDLGFKLIWNDNGTVCYWLSSTNDILNYTKAALACRDKGLQLVTLKTVKKAYLFLDIVKNITTDFWIGLNDMETESVFRWEDDDSPAASEVLKIVFAPTEPWSDNKDEDCVEFKVEKQPGNDAECILQKRYMCEVIPKY